MRAPDPLRKALLAAVFASIFVGPMPLGADGEYLVQDLGQARMPSLAAGDSIRDHAVLDGVAYFFLDDERHGYELWRSDGTIAGTHLLLDVCPGRCGAEQFYSFGLAAVGDRIFFAADDGVHGSELWVTDGTIPGTRMVADIRPGPASSRPYGMVEAFEEVWFLAGEPWTERRVWRSDGTSAGTRPLFEEATDPLGPHVSSLLEGPGLVFVIHTEPSYGLWRTDGTLTGTFELHGGFTAPTLFEATGAATTLPNGSLVFTGCDNDTGCEPWRSDGTLAGTLRLGDLRPGTESSYASGFHRVGSEVWFEAQLSFGQTVLYRTDGTPSGTIQIQQPAGVSVSTRNGTATPLGGGLVFVGCSASSGCEPWFSDGSGAVQLADLVVGSQSSVGMTASFSHPRMTELGVRAAFLADDGNGQLGLWSTDGTPSGTVALSNLDSYPAGSSFGFFPAIERSIVVNGQWLLSLFRPDRGLEIWRSDGTAAGTGSILTAATEASAFFAALESFYTPSQRPCFSPLRQGVVAKVANLESVGESTLIFSDGVPGGVANLVLLDESERGRSAECATNGNEVLTVAPTGVWRSSGTAASTELLSSDFDSRGASPVVEIHRDRFALFGSDPQSPTPTALFMIPSAPAGSDSIVRLPSTLPWGELKSTNELLYVVDGSGGLEITDGLVEPSLILEPLTEPPFGSGNSDPILVADHLFFVRDSSETGGELWKSDGTIEGTCLVREVRPGPEGGLERRDGVEAWNLPFETRLAAGGEGRVLFPANDGKSGVELWSSDGTAEGTVVVADIIPGPDGSWPRHLRSLEDGVVIFAAEHPTFGYELFRTDGTAAGTSVVRDLVTGLGSSVPDDFVVQDGVLYFSAWTREHGREAWRSDGTAAGTWRLTDVAPGPLSSSPSRFVRRGNRLFFTATDHVHGFELWARADDGSVPLFIDGFDTEDTSRWSQSIP
ncbi:MAG: hypothetical protein AMXMBFR36_01750 [Acidobacteriota bacterium]